MPKKYSNKHYYNRTNTCDRCREEGKNTKLVSGNSFREHNDDGKWTGRWLCKSCYNKDYDKRPDSRNSAIKKLADRRTGNIDPNSNSAKGDIFEEVTCRIRGVKRLSIEDNNYGLHFDHSIDSELGIIQTKGSVYSTIDERWEANVTNEYGKEFDHLIFYCADKDMKNIERIYIFPRIEIIKRKTIGIYKNPMNSRGTRSIIPWYEKYRVRDNEFIVKVNEIFQMIIKEIKRR